MIYVVSNALYVHSNFKTYLLAGKGVHHLQVNIHHQTEKSKVAGTKKSPSQKKKWKG